MGGCATPGTFLSCFDTCGALLGDTPRPRLALVGRPQLFARLPGAALQRVPHLATVGETQGAYTPGNVDRPSGAHRGDRSASPRGPCRREFPDAQLDDHCARGPDPV